jgi:hypothetical protein
MNLDIFKKSFDAPPQPELLEAWQAHFAWRTAPKTKDKALNRLIGELIPPTPPLPSAGQLWSLKRELDGPNEDGRHLNMPVALILSVVGSKLQVMATAPFYELMGSGDIWLGEDEGFVETWNRFTLPLGALGEFRGEVSQELLERIRATKPVRPHTSGLDWEEAFLNLESEIAEAACFRAAIRQCATAPLLDRLGEFFWTKFRELAAVLLPSAGDLGAPLTAASGKSVAAFFRTPKGFKTGAAKITGILDDNGLTAIKGTLSPPDDFSMDALFVWRETTKDESLTPEKVLFDSPSFEIEFLSDNSFDLSELKLLVVSYGA